ncbi:hypothetical protein ABIE26_003990 [Pedobacter africanus]|uniref:Uncharacterized protein n=1 Tax=Pedobacter africanus TaxID=151894 RepID=A0ACC6L1D3_9SPHI|nr:hypothetical protein [Pedobacter africanus]MDR6785291.1 hypothetical protein [Pedobacter africanus]
MTKELFFTANDGITYTVTVTSIPFNDNGTNRIKFEVKDPFSINILQRQEQDNWVILEGDIKPEHVKLVGAVIRKNFNT